MGAELLRLITITGAAAHGYKVCITRHRNTFVNRQWNGNIAIRINEENARTPNIGTTTCIRFNPNVISTPDGGARPAFIGLAHELIHALHNLQGTANRDTPEEERRTVGIGAYVNEAICENAIRREHGIPIRTDYTGL